MLFRSQRMNLAYTIADNWYDRMIWCLERYPQLFRLYALSSPQEHHSIEDNLAVFNVLYRKGIFGANEKTAMQEFTALCCRVSIPDLIELVAKKQKTDSATATGFVMGELGKKTEEDPDNGGLITSKWKARSLRKLPRH